MQQPPRYAASGPSLGELSAVALLAAGGLAYEIALTRLLSALLVSSWVAPVLAVALLGVGLGAAVVALFPAARSRGAARSAAGMAAVLASLSLPMWLWAAGIGRPLLGLVLPLLTYVAIGVGSSAVISWHPRKAAWLLRADYGSAALAAALTPALIGWLGGGALTAATFAATLPGVAAVALSRARAAEGRQGTPEAAGGFDVPLAATLIGIAAPLLTALALAAGVLAVDPALHMKAKPIVNALNRGGVLEATSWDATARTDLVRTPDGARYLYMDGGAGSLVPAPDPSGWSHDVGAFAFALAPADSAFLIGTGGGLDVAQARAHGVDDVVAVEVNRASVELVRELSGDAADVYGPGTEVVIGDGRRVLAARSETFDVITLANVVTGSAELRGAALTENLVYTVEAFGEYLDHLEPGGRVALKLYDELTLTRALTTALTALVSGGYAADAPGAMAHVVAVLDTSGRSAVPLLIVKREPFTLAEAVAAGRIAEARGWALLVVPGLLAPPSLQALAEGEADLQDVVAASRDADVSATYDAAPYFFSFEPGVPRDVRRAGSLSVLVLLVLVAVALGTGGLAAGTRARAENRRSLLAAVWLGAGFLLVELAALPVVQRAAGHPAWSLSLTLGAVLIGSALGAQLASRSRSVDVRGPAALAAVTIAVWYLAAPYLTGLLVAAPPLVAGLVLSGTLAIAAVPMGLPFPRLLASLDRSSGVAGALALAGVAAVAAGAGTLWLSHASGASAVGMAAVCAYLVAALLAPRTRPSEA